MFSGSNSSGTLAGAGLAVRLFHGGPIWQAIGLAREPVMRYFDSMQTVRVEIPAELVSAAGLDTGNLSAETARLLALGLYREDKVSLGRAAELCRMPVEQFMEYAAQHNVPLHYGADDLEEDRRTLERLGL